MNRDKVNDLFKKAGENLRAANDEMYKPEEDVVTYLVCKNSQYAIVNYLKGFLQFRGFETHENETLQGLLDRCTQLEPRFKNVSFKNIDCKAHVIDSTYCEDVKKVSSCYETADQVDDFLRSLKIL